MVRFSDPSGSAKKKKDPASIPYTKEWYARQAKAYTGRVDKRKAESRTVPVRRKAAPAPTKKTYTMRGAPRRTQARPAASSSGGYTRRASSGGGGGGGNGGYAAGYNKAVAEANAKKDNDAPQMAALRKMLATSFESARNTKIGNLRRILSQQDSVILGDYLLRSKQLAGARKDNERSEADSSFANLANRARERGDIMAQATAQGAGESDTLKATLVALKNWSSNQADVNRSFFDTARSVNTGIVDLNSDTRTARANLYGGSLSDQEQVWANYYNQRADAYTQMGNIQANKQSDSYKKDGNGHAMAAIEAGKSWKSPGIPTSVVKWKGSVQEKEAQLNNTAFQGRTTNLGPRKRPEGATLRKW